MDLHSINIECPICMDIIDLNNNCIKTECGHMFHSSCLMKNISHNGFNCPYCRNVMAEEPEEEEDTDDDEYNEDEEEGEEEGEEGPVPTASYVAQKLLEQGVTFEQVIHMICNIDHDEYDDHENANIFEDDLFGKIRIIVSNYREDPETDVTTISPEENRTIDMSDSKIIVTNNVHDVNKECID